MTPSEKLIIHAITNSANREPITLKEALGVSYTRVVSLFSPPDLLGRKYPD